MKFSIKSTTVENSLFTVKVLGNPMAGQSQKPRINQTTWTQDSRAAGHEFGHMIGNPDEYLGDLRDADGKLLPFGKTDQWNVMGKHGGGPRARHFGTIIKAVNKNCRAVPINEKCE